MIRFLILIGLCALILIGCKINQQVDKVTPASVESFTGPVPQFIEMETNEFDGTDLRTVTTMTKHFDVTPLIAAYSIMACVVWTNDSLPFDTHRWAIMTNGSPTDHYMWDDGTNIWRRVFQFTVDSTLAKKRFFRGELVMR